MMVALNSRITISDRGSGSTDYSTESDSEIRPNASHGDVVMHEQWTTASPEAHKLHVSIDYPILFSLILIWGIEC